MKKQTRNRIYTIAIIVLGLLVVIPVYTSFQPGFYKNTDSIKRYHKTWVSSTHNKMSCVDCHVEEGITNWLTYEWASFTLFYRELFSNPKDVEIFAKPSKKACQKCHTKYRAISPSGDLLIPHQAHVEVLKLKCNQCHKSLVHKKNLKGLNSPFMGGCLKCHNGEKASKKCKSCHTEKAYPENHQANNWLEVHGSKKHEIDCSECHAWTPDFCQECHEERPPSHAGNWKTLHSSKAKVSTSSCGICHKESKCALCHDKTRAQDLMKSAKKGIE